MTPTRTLSGIDRQTMRVLRQLPTNASTMRRDERRRDRGFAEDVRSPPRGRSVD